MNKPIECQTCKYLDSARGFPQEPCSCCAVYEYKVKKKIIPLDKNTVDKE